MTESLTLSDSPLNASFQFSGFSWASVRGTSRACAASSSSHSATLAISDHLANPRPHAVRTGVIPLLVHRRPAVLIAQTAAESKSYGSYTALVSCLRVQ